MTRLYEVMVRNVTGIRGSDHVHPGLRGLNHVHVKLTSVKHDWVPVYNPAHSGW